MSKINNVRVFLRYIEYASGMVTIKTKKRRNLITLKRYKTCESLEKNILK